MSVPTGKRLKKGQNSELQPAVTATEGTEENIKQDGTENTQQDNLTQPVDNQNAAYSNADLTFILAQQQARIQELSQAFYMSYDPSIGQEIQQQNQTETGQGQDPRSEDDEITSILNHAEQNRQAGGYEPPDNPYEDYHPEGVNSYEEDEMDDSVREMLEELQQQPEVGSKVNPVTAKAFQSIPDYSVRKETFERWKTEYKTPENCSNLVVPQVNPEIWHSLPVNFKTSDAKSQALEHHLVRALIAQSRVMDVAISELSKTGLSRIMKPLLDASKCVAIAAQEIRQKRKNNLRPALKPEYAALSSAKIPTAKYLFGDNFEQTSKSVRTTSSVVRQQVIVSRRFNPLFRHPQRTQNLNFFRPPGPTPFRGAPSFRGPRQPSRGVFQQRFPKNRQF